MWLTLLQGILKRPWIIAIVALVAFAGFQYVKIGVLESKIGKMEGQIAQIQANYDTCVSNEVNLVATIDGFRQEKENLNNTITGLQQQVIDEQANTAEWQRKYKNRPVITKVKEVPVIQYVEKGVVVDEETSKEYVRYFNTLFAD